MINVFKFQLHCIKNNRITLIGIIIIAGITLFEGYKDNALLQSMAYMLAMWVCSFLTDAYALWKPAKSDLPVRHPKTETRYVLLCTGLGILALLLRFDLLKWETLPGMIRLVIAAPLILCTFPVAIAIILLFKKYRPSDLGVRWHGLLLALPVIAVVFITTKMVAPQRFTWSMIYKEADGNILSVLFMGLITAGLSEEFMKMVLFTRLGALWNNKGLAWLVAVIIWGLMHAPKWYSEERNITEAILSAIRIMPIGLMWSYLTYRTKSILPAVLVHGLNFWGLQNF